ncbi:HNH endonuclease [Prosthecobacter sp.]|uniref:HNH endonuclease n=1 Tax=Prosthecobacter sp. TaxID=1965333 RepID=UPI001D2983BC|nr:HNH endonuclease [Prosthecobacter sp.]MCB1275730.1 HNH endonuclease [Prosthecobacter sp.]
MGIVLLVSAAALACLAGWITHAIEKRLRSRPSPREEKKLALSNQPPVNAPFAVKRSSPTEKTDVAPQPERIIQPSIPTIEPQGIETRFDYWQGTGTDKYPPDWKFRSAEVRKRDGDRCQVAGCPNLDSKHVHHLDAIKNGGSHVLSNLITLCAFHHALMPDHLEAIGENNPSERFSVRQRHTRRNQVNPGFHRVRPTVVRYVTASKEDILLAVRSFGWSCPNCHRLGFECEGRQQPDWARFNSAGKPIDCEWRLVCQQNGCGYAWYFQGGLLEEVGLTLARRVFLQTSNPKLRQYEDSWLEDFQFIEAPACPRTDCLGHLVWRFNRNDGSLFQGCTEWRLHR